MSESAEVDRLTAVKADKTPLVRICAERIRILVELVEAERSSLFWQRVRDTSPLHPSAGFSSTIKVIPHGGVDMQQRGRMRFHCALSLDPWGLQLDSQTSPISAIRSTAPDDVVPTVATGFVRLASYSDKTATH